MNRLKVFLNYSNKKPIFKMIKEVLILTIKKREIPFYYFKYLYRKDAIDYLDHLSLKEQIKIQTHPTIHKAEYYNVINNKLLFSVLSEKLSLKAPELLSFNFETNFFYKNETIKIID